MRYIKHLVFLLTTGLFSTASIADNHTGIYVGVDAGIGAFDGHCEQISTTRDNANLTINIEIQVSTTVTLDQGSNVSLNPIRLDNVSSRIANINSSTSNCDDSITNFTGVVGYQINDNFSVEGFYNINSAVDINGDIVTQGTINIGPNSHYYVLGQTLTISTYIPNFSGMTNATTTISFSDELAVNSYGLNVKGNFPVSDSLDVFGKLGLHFWDESHTYQIANAAPPTSVSILVPHPNPISLLAMETVTARITQLSYSNANELLTPIVADKTGTGVLLGAGAKYKFSPNFNLNAGVDILTGDVNTNKYYAGLSFKF